jgi:hypothetical protein
MSRVRIALANVRVPSTPQESVLLATSAIDEAGRQGAIVICFPECFVPGYRWPGTTPPPPDPAFLERAWAEVAGAASAAHITVVLGTERVTDRGLQNHCLCHQPRWDDRGVARQGADRPVRGNHLPGTRDRASGFRGWAINLRCSDLSRRMALSGNRALGRASRRAGRVSSTCSCCRTR